MIFSSFPPFFSPFYVSSPFIIFNLLFFSERLVCPLLLLDVSRYNCPRPFTSDIFSHFGRCWESILLWRTTWMYCYGPRWNGHSNNNVRKRWWRRKIIKQRNRKQWRWEDRIEPISVQQFHSYRIDLLLVQKGVHLSQLLCPLSGHFN